MNAALTESPRPPRRDAHRAPDPAPIEEPPADPFENFDPHQPPIRTPNNDEPPIDPNPSIRRSRQAHAARNAGVGNSGSEHFSGK